MKVLITGGTGSVGSAVTARLIERGWDVRVIGVERMRRVAGGEYVRCDITDFNRLRKQMRGCEAVIHLAAHASPRDTPGHEVFRVNASGTFNVFEAAAAEGVRRIVQASSINAVGCTWNITDLHPPYFPVDEDYPSITTDPYSLSKKIAEEIAAYFWRRDGISSVSLRMPWVYAAEALQSAKRQARIARIRALLDELVALPAEERQARVDAAIQRSLAFRARRGMEYPQTISPMVDKPPSDLLDSVIHTDRFSYWSVLDKRNAALAFELALTAEFEGSHPLFVNDRCNWLDYDTHTLARLFFPEVTEWRADIHGTASLISNARAHALIGYAPVYSLSPN